MAELSDKKLSSSLEDYIEAIFNLAAGNDGGAARSSDIAQKLGVAKASVTGALRVLKDRGLVNYRPYGEVTLTASGVRAAAAVAQKHKILKLFFMDVLGVDGETAQKAACRSEHAFGNELIARLLCFIEFVNKSAGSSGGVGDEFKGYCRKRLAKNRDIVNGKAAT
ncbi:MAG: metal-dependent transcriptional regulator [Phycisphaerae bacterium]|nr:metal-dependent transcriptional regulator [Phycisphaerae bacterium]